MSIGEKIAELRRQKGITQEVLAKAAGVSPPAVSKWENGGSPDIELLPIIADFFGISIDELFGREPPERTDGKSEMMRPILGAASWDDRLNIVFDYCWSLQLALFGKTSSANENAIDAVAEALEDEMVAHSEINNNNGFARVRLNESRRYFLFAPEPEAGWCFDNIGEYTRLFSDLSDEQFLKTLIFFHKNPSAAFTSKLLIREFGYGEDIAIGIIERLKAYEMIAEQDITLDDELIRFFAFKENAAIVPFLIFSEEIIKKTQYYTFSYLNRDNSWLT